MLWCELNRWKNYQNVENKVWGRDSVLTTKSVSEGEKKKILNVRRLQWAYHLKNQRIFFSQEERRKQNRRETKKIKKVFFFAQISCCGFEVCFALLFKPSPFWNFLSFFFLIFVAGFAFAFVSELFCAWILG